MHVAGSTRLQCAEHAFLEKSQLARVFKTKCSVACSQHVIWQVDEKQLDKKQVYRKQLCRNQEFGHASLYSIHLFATRPFHLRDTLHLPNNYTMNVSVKVEPVTPKPDHITASSADETIDHGKGAGLPKEEIVLSESEEEEEVEPREVKQEEVRNEAKDVDTQNSWKIVRCDLKKQLDGTRYVACKSDDHLLIRDGANVTSPTSATAKRG